ncbi:MAG TPA: M20/M25/M40 family metallo-hydrolase, partial [Burkholderiales bacterium]
MTQIAKFWDEAIVPALVDYIRIPAKSPHFDHDWARHGHIGAAVKLAADWCRRHAVPGMKLEVIQLEKRTPVLFVELPGKGEGNILVYGHLDKQPEMSGWREGLGPWTPKLEGEKLYGRGGADDGYAVFCALAAVRALEQEERPHARIAMLIECCEESGSYDLPAYLEALAPRLGAPDLVIGLDSGCGNYEQLWGTTSLRGLVNGVLTVEVLAEGVHSGDASGVVPSSFRVARLLLERIDDAETGIVKHSAFHAQVPPERGEQAKRAAEVLGEEIWRKFPFAGGTRPVSIDLADLVLNRTWRPMLAVTGADGLPPPAGAGNVLRPKTSLVLSLRLPPTVRAESAARQLQAILETDPPYGAKVKFDYGQAATGWHAPQTASWLDAALETSSIKNYGKSAMWMGEGGTIPFMAMLGARFPQAQ